MANYLTQDDVNNYGDLVDVARRASLHELGPRIDNLAQQNQELRHWLGVESRHRMDREVAAAVPNLQEIDQDPRWHSWLTQLDALSGRPRQQLLNEAIAQGAVNRVVRFFQQFENQAAAQASYYGGGASSKPTYTRAQIAQIYTAHRKGAYAGREAEWNRQERDIIAATREGRIQAYDYITK